MEILQTIWTALTTENQVLIDILGIPFIVIETLVTVLLSTSILNIKVTKKSISLYVTIIFFLSIVSNNFLPEIYKIFVNLIITPIIIILIFKTNILKAILAIILPMLIFLVSESIFIKLYMNLFGVSQYNIITIPIYRETLALLDYGFIYLLYVLIKHFKLNINLFDNIDKKSKILLIFNSIFCLISIVLQLYLINFYNQGLPVYIIIISICSLFAYFAISLYSIINTSKLLILNINLNQEKEHNRILKLLQDDLRGFRHDFANIICTIGGYVHSKDIEGLTNYYNQIQKDVVKVNNLTALNPDIINNPAIYALITSKYDKASNLNISVSVEVFINLNTLNMKIYEFTRILGILLDNAIEAAEECEEKNIYVQIRKDNKFNRQLLIVENTYKDKNINTDKIFEKNYSTKPQNTGLGLWEVRQILKRNTNLNLYTTKSERLFKQQLEIYNK